MSLAGFLAIVLAGFVGGCAGVPSVVPQADQYVGQRQAVSALQDAKAETATLRAELATARIAAAKQEAELRELRRQVTELQQMVEAKHAELISLRNEKDGLTEAATVAQVRVADSVASQPSADELGAMKARLLDMETALAALAAELAQVKKALQPSPRPSPEAGEGVRTPAASSPASGEDTR